MCLQKNLFLVLLLSACSANADYRDIVLDQGVVRGHDVDADDVISFYGIPYATVPPREDRFKAPLPPPSWDGVLNATGDNIVCLQGKEFDPDVIKAVKVYDCLIMNVFIPKDTNETKLPVLSYIHGGAFQFGNGHQMMPTGLVQRKMIAVNFNFRVGVHGFLCLNTEYAPGNAGLKDIIAALKWVKANIARFGGDPDNISLSGSSSGSNAAEFVVLSPMSAGLLTRAMFESGAALGPTMITTEPITIAEKFANQHGVYTNKNVSLLESFYKSITNEHLNTLFTRDHPHVGFVACVETHNLEGVEKFLPEAPIDIFYKGNYDKIPLMIGFTPYDAMHEFLTYNDFKADMEANLTDFIPTSVQIESEEQAQRVTELIRNMYFPTGEVTAKGFINFLTDSAFTHSLYASARLHARNGIPVYLYMFTFNGTANLLVQEKAPVWGPGHCAQSLYIYDYEEKIIYKDTNERDIVMKNKLRDIYYSFCKFGKPDVSAFLDNDWLPVTVDKVNFLTIDDEFHMDEFPLRERLQLWDEILKYDYKPNESGLASRNTFSLVLVFSFIIVLFI